TVIVERNERGAEEDPLIVVDTTTTIAPNSLAVIPLATREVSGLDSDTGPPSRSRVSAAAYRITTSLPTVAYQFNPLDNEGIYSNDASLLVPVHALDESYVVLGWPGQGNAAPAPIQADNRSFVTIVAAHDDTRVRFVPSTAVQPGDGVPALAPNQELEVRLNAFGVLNLQGADYAIAGETDFTGSRVEADKPVIVFSGVEAISISSPNEGFCCADHLEEQMLPRSSLGAEYAVVRSMPRSNAEPEPDYFKVVALTDGTTVTTSLPAPDDQFVLGRGESRLVLSATSFALQSSHPVMVAQFLLSGESVERQEVDPFTGEVLSEEQSEEGDPSFMMVPPIAQFRSQYRFLVPAGYEHNAALVAAPRGAALRLDGAVLPCDRTSMGVIAGTDYEALHCRLREGAHYLESDVPVGLVITGWGPSVVSYGYTGGMDFEPVNADCVEDTECPGGEFCSGGYCVPEIDFI
ncbi:MAG: hypothetical protein IT379_10000, partial [Deltaproteobacteria bacterium]|nr:hypothetical protein [Deltaproteobacteria bacterium]